MVKERNGGERSKYNQKAKREVLDKIKELWRTQSKSVVLSSSQVCMKRSIAKVIGNGMRPWRKEYFPKWVGVWKSTFRHDSFIMHIQSQSLMKQKNKCITYRCKIRSLLLAICKWMKDKGHHLILLISIAVAKELRRGRSEWRPHLLQCPALISPVFISLV